MSKYEKFVFYLLIFLIPFQARKVLFLWSAGFNEWLSAYLYLTDILIIFLFVGWLVRNRQKRFLKEFNWKIGERIKGVDLWLILFVLVAFLSLSQAANLSLGFYGLIKLIELAFLFFYVKYNLKVLSWLKIAWLVVVGAFLQSVIAILQFAYQKSLSLRILFESVLNVDMVGVAKISASGLKMIRAYGTFPHPNVLAGFLILALFLLYYLWLRKKHSIFKSGLFLFIYAVLVFALFLTFSRVALLCFIVLSFIYFIFVFFKAMAFENRLHVIPAKAGIQQADQLVSGFRPSEASRHQACPVSGTGYGMTGSFEESEINGIKSEKLALKSMVGFAVFIALIAFMFLALNSEIANRFDISGQDQAVTLRSFYNQSSLMFVADYPVLGIGLANFVSEFRYMYSLLAAWLFQPVHNIYLLISSEVGLIGLIIFLFFIFQILRHFLIKKVEQDEYYLSMVLLNSSLFFALISFLFIGLFDHFLITLQQGQLMLWLILGFLAGQGMEKEKTLA